MSPLGTGLTKKHVFIYLLSFNVFNSNSLVDEDLVSKPLNQGWGAGAGCFWLLGAAAGAAWKKDQKPEPLGKKSQEPEPLKN